MLAKKRITRTFTNFSFHNSLGYENFYEMSSSKFYFEELKSIINYYETENSLSFIRSHVFLCLNPSN